jgi:hypothetical protein
VSGGRKWCGWRGVRVNPKSHLYKIPVEWASLGH